MRHPIVPAAAASTVATIVAAAVAMLFAGAASAAIVVNGSFEQGPRSGNFSTYGTGSTAITGWTVTAGSVDHIARYWTASDGLRSLDLSGTQAGTIAQMIPTIAGTRYTVSFDISSNPDRSSVKSMLVGFGSATPTAVTFTGPIQRALVWTPVALQFVATASTTSLSFKSTTPGAWGIALDNVEVTAGGVPEPATWALLIAGFGLVGARLRRRPLLERRSC
jgi:choice-of-anchor C domain-containing protein